MYVLEAILVSMILLGAAYAVQSLQGTSLEQERPQNELERLVRDALVVLEGLDDGNGTSLLDLSLAEALHCAEDASPSTTDCDGGRSRNMSIKLESYLPRGAGYAFGIANGVTHRDIYRSPQPMGEAVSTSITISPQWNTTFVATDFSCYPSGVDIQATLVPIDQAHVAWSRWGNLTVGTTEHAGVEASTPRWWSATITGARPAAGTTFANVTGNASLEGGTTWAFCGHNGLTTDIRTALAAVAFGPSATKVPLGGSVTLSADLAPLLALPGLTVNHANVTLYEPLPIRNATADTWIVTSEVALAGDSLRSAIWAPPEETLYGAHPALLRVNLTAGSASFEVRRITLVDVALPSGEVPFEPPYRATLQAWLPDWG